MWSTSQIEENISCLLNSKRPRGPKITELYENSMEAGIEVNEAAIRACSHHIDLEMEFTIGLIRKRQILSCSLMFWCKCFARNFFCQRFLIQNLYKQLTNFLCSASISIVSNLDSVNYEFSMIISVNLFFKCHYNTSC